MSRSISTRQLRQVMFGATLALAALGVADRASAQGANVDNASAEQKKTAQKAFEDGLKASKAKKHDEALAAFKNSYDAVASPNSMLPMTINAGESLDVDSMRQGPLIDESDRGLTMMSVPRMREFMMRMRFPLQLMR